MRATPTAAQLAAAAQRAVDERNEMRELLRRVDDSVLDRAPDGMSIAYLSVDVLGAIRRLTR